MFVMAYFSCAHTDAFTCTRAFFTYCNMWSQWCAQPSILRNTYCTVPSQPSFHQRGCAILSLVWLLPWSDGCWAASHPPAPYERSSMVPTDGHYTGEENNKQPPSLVSRCIMSPCAVGTLDYIKASVSDAQLPTAIFELECVRLKLAFFSVCCW